jgi:hypothetical protein
LGRNSTSTGLLHVVKSTVVKRSTLTPGGPSVELRPCASGVRGTIQINSESRYASWHERTFDMNRDATTSPREGVMRGTKRLCVTADCGPMKAIIPFATTVCDHRTRAVGRTTPLAAATSRSLEDRGGRHTMVRRNNRFTGPTNRDKHLEARRRWIRRRKRGKNSGSGRVIHGWRLQPRRKRQWIGRPREQPPRCKGVSGGIHEKDGCHAFVAWWQHLCTAVRNAECEQVRHRELHAECATHEC